MTVLPCQESAGANKYNRRINIPARTGIRLKLLPRVHSLKACTQKTITRSEKIHRAGLAKRNAARTRAYGVIKRINRRVERIYISLSQSCKFPNDLLKIQGIDEHFYQCWLLFHFKSHAPLNSPRFRSRDEKLYILISRAGTHRSLRLIHRVAVRHTCIIASLLMFTYFL